ncbi:ribonuclease T2 [Eremomyces bilateralis CBS 781.70]|uniref:ribonuclease T2 n=1 Tax=Eremomyces bilateralis CBS 781.70 TaxID=1392243 RepID=A0A6G1FW27_9PEZI|nr:ribonuclease T2 [Eremomyces bilateralis CBS 781.70]KAF1810037.1 ribonuclease T2 [Eremomyces bilateralis CBS 781.70]
MKFVYLAIGASIAEVANAALYENTTSANHTCSIQTPYLSCSTNANPGLVDSCCVETFGGLVMGTQFWDTYTGLESKGQLLPERSWTIHGLWPDFCNGSYTQYCDLSRQFDPDPSPNTTNSLPNGTVVPAYGGPDISPVFEAFGKRDLLEYMNKFWIAQGTPNWELWAHEFSKHATCFSTFDVACYGPQYRENEDIIDFFESTIRYFKKQPTWEWLARWDITPSNSTTYSFAEIRDALASEYGAVPYVGCSGPKYNDTKAGRGSSDNGGTVFNEVWYFSHVFGKPQYGDYVPTDVGSFATTCAKTPGAIRYPSRTNGSEWSRNKP